MLPIDHNLFSWLIVLNIFLYFLPSLHICDMSSYIYYQLITYFPSSLKNGGNQKKNSKSSNHIYPGIYSWVYGDTIVTWLLRINTPSCSPRSTSILCPLSYSPFLSHSRIIRQQFSQLSPVSSFFSFHLIIPIKQVWFDFTTIKNDLLLTPYLLPAVTSVFISPFKITL